MVFDRGGVDGAVFTQSLESLKNRGCSLLVVGSALDAGQSELCGLLLGEPTAERRRLLVRTDGECGVAPVDEDVPTQMVTRATIVREATSAAPGAELPDTYVDSDDVGCLEGAVLEALEELTASRTDPDPSEVRLCFDSLLPLLADHDGARVRRMVARLADRVRAVDGMAHFHLPTDSEHEYVEELGTVVDAVVETRVHDGQPEQRWHVLDGAVDSGWLSL